jgi:hypothetical protein
MASIPVSSRTAALKVAVSGGTTEEMMAPSKLLKLIPSKASISLIRPRTQTPYAKRRRQALSDADILALYAAQHNVGVAISTARIIKIISPADPAWFAKAPCTRRSR